MKLRKEALVELEDVLLDATCIEAVLFARVDESVQERFKDCAFGKKVVEKRWFFGRKLHLLSSPKGTMISFRLTSGNIHDSRVFSKLNHKRFKRLTGDSGYRGARGLPGQKLAITQPFATATQQRQLNGKRVGIERVFNGLKKLNLEKGLILKNAQSLGSHILSVLTCLLGIQYLNLKQGLKPMAYGRFLL